MMRGTQFPCNLGIFWTAILGKGRDQKNGGGVEMPTCFNIQYINYHFMNGL